MNESETTQKISIPLIYSSCEKYKRLEKGFFLSWELFFPDFIGPVYSTANGTCAPTQYRVYTLKHKHKAKSFSTRLLLTIDSIPSPYVLFALDDFWLKKAVDLHLLKEAICCLENDESIAFINLNEQGEGKSYSSSFVATEPTASYRVCTQIGIWRVSCLYKLLRIGESAWAFENYGTERSRFTRLKFLRLKPGVSAAFDYIYGGILHAGALRKIPEAKEQIIRLGLQNEMAEFDRDPSPRVKQLLLLRCIKGGYRCVYRLLSRHFRFPYLLRY